MFVIFLMASAAVLAAVRAGATARYSAMFLGLIPALLVSVVLHFTERDFSGNAADTVNQTPGSHNSRQSVPGDWRVSLEGFRFPVTVGMPPIRIGGSASSDHLYLPRLPDGFLQIQAQSTAAGNVLLHLTQRAPDPADRRRGLALFSAPTSGGPDLPLGGYVLAPDAGVCRSGNDSCEKDSLLALGQACLPAAADSHLPPPERRIYPLASAGRHSCSGAHFSWQDGLPSLDFIYWCTKYHGALCILPLESENLTLVSGSTTQRLSRGEMKLPADGESYTVRLLRLAGERDFAGNESGNEGRTRLSEQRSLRLRYVKAAEGRPAELYIFPETPEVTDVRAPEDGQLSVVADAANPVNLPRDRTVVGFSLIGAPVAAHLSNLIRVPAPDSEGEAAKTLRVQSVTGIGSIHSGEPFLLGDQIAVKLRAIKLELPLAWLHVIWLLALLNVVVRSQLGLPVGALIVLAVLDILLCMRLLVAFESSLVDPGKTDVVVAAWGALLILPAALELAFPPWRSLYGATAIAFVTRIVALIAGCALLAWFDGWFPPWIGLYPAVARGLGQSIMVGLVLFLLARAFLRGWLPRLVDVCNLGYERGAQNSGHIAYLWQRVSALPSGQSGIVRRLCCDFFFAFAPFVAVVAGHLALVILGWREKLGPVRTTAVIVPLLVLAWSWSLHATRALQREFESSLPAGLINLAVLGLLFLPPLAVFMFARDNGAYIYLIALAIFVVRLAKPFTLALLPPLLVWAAVSVALIAGYLAFADDLVAMNAAAPFRALFFASLTVLAAAAVLCWRAGKRDFLRSLWLAPLALPVFLFLGLHVSGAVSERSPQTEASASLADQAGLDAMARANTQTNFIRLFSLVLPDAVERIGTQDAYRQRVQLEEMRAQSAPLRGRGWLRTERPVELRDTHVSDTVTAVHLMSPFGRVATAGLCGVLIALILALEVLLRSRSSRAAIAAVLAATVLGSVSIYMVLANTGAVPFTGRNFYFAAVSSGSDLLEGGLLILIMLHAFHAPFRGAPR